MLIKLYVSYVYTFRFKCDTIKKKRLVDLFIYTYVIYKINVMLIRNITFGLNFFEFGKVIR